MKIEIKVKHSYNNRYMVCFSVPKSSGETLDIVSHFTYNGISLEECVNRAKKGASGRLNLLRNQGIAAVTSRHAQLVWDTDVSFLPSIMQKQKELGDATYVATKPSIVVEDEEPSKLAKAEALYEVVQVNRVWTLHKHEQPLLSWEAACELLKQKVETNE